MRFSSPRPDAQNGRRSSTWDGNLSRPVPPAPTATSFNDTSWQSVSIPHSASYDAPYYNSENKHFQGTCWYRKHFTCPATAQKVFMHFEGAMQTCDLFVNGDSIGSHSHSGYTAFNFDISNALIRGGSDVVAIRLNNTYSTSIPREGRIPAVRPTTLFFPDSTGMSGCSSRTAFTSLTGASEFTRLAPPQAPRCAHEPLWQTQPPPQRVRRSRLPCSMQPARA